MAQEGKKLSEQLSEKEKRELNERADQGETVVPGGTRGKTLEFQERLAEGRSKGGQAQREQLGTEGYQEMGKKGGISRVVKELRRKESKLTRPKYRTAS